MGALCCWAYGAGFDRRTEESVPEAGLEVVESRLVVDDLINREFFLKNREAK